MDLLEVKQVEDKQDHVLLSDGDMGAGSMLEKSRKNRILAIKKEKEKQRLASVKPRQRSKAKIKKLAGQPYRPRQFGWRPRFPGPRLEGYLASLEKKRRSLANITDDGKNENNSGEGHAVGDIPGVTFNS